MWKALNLSLAVLGEHQREFIRVAELACRFALEIEGEHSESLHVIVFILFCLTVSNIAQIR